MSSRDRFRKNQSMNSTHHMSCNQSCADNFYPESKPSLMLNYAHVPMEKPVPRWNQSSATWRYSSQKHAFSKDSRFKQYKLNYTDILCPQLPSQLNSTTCTFGYGTRRPISTLVLRNAKQKPAPDCYDFTYVDEAPRSKDKGKSFGIGWKSYAKVYLKHRKDVYAEFQSEDNPPAQYQIREIPGAKAKKFATHGRLKMYTQKMAESKHWVPGPCHEVEDRELYGMTGLNERNFAFGERIDLAKPANNYPGPQYRLPGFCDKFTNIHRKLEKPTNHTVR